MTPPSVNGTSQQQSQSNNQQFQYQKQQQNTGPQKLGKKKKYYRGFHTLNLLKKTTIIVPWGQIITHTSFNYYINTSRQSAL